MLTTSMPAVVVHGEPFVSVSVSHSSCDSLLSPTAIQRSASCTSLLYTFNHRESSMLCIKFASAIKMPQEVCGPATAEDEPLPSKWRLDVRDGKAIWKL